MYASRASVRRPCFSSTSPATATVKATFGASRNASSMSAARLAGVVQLGVREGPLRQNRGSLLRQQGARLRVRQRLRQVGDGRVVVLDEVVGAPAQHPQAEGFGLETHRFVEVGERLLAIALGEVGLSAAVIPPQEARRVPYRHRIVGDRLVVLVFAQARIATLAVVLRIVGIELDGAAEVGDGFFVAPEHFVGGAAIAESYGAVAFAEPTVFIKARAGGDRRLGVGRIGALFILAAEGATRHSIAYPAHGEEERDGR